MPEQGGASRWQPGDAELAVAIAAVLDPQQWCTLGEICERLPQYPVREVQRVCALMAQVGRFVEERPGPHPRYRLA
jgi:hypothetical protein